MPIRILSTESFLLNMRTRMPFRYGIVTLTALPHLFLKIEAEIDGRRQTGFAADHLPAKWFNKNPDSAPKDDTLELLGVIDSACAIARALPSAKSVFGYWRNLYQQQGAWGGGWGKPPLLSHFGTSLVERALIDAYCKLSAVPFSKAVQENRFGIDLESIHPELVGSAPRDWLPAAPLRSVIARHTIGMVDPLTDAEIADEERLDDGLPQSLEACISAYGLTHFKIKLWGEAPKDVDRVRRIADVIARNAADGNYAFTFDANENFKAVEPFRDFWEELTAEPSLAAFLSKLLFVEQPLHRSVAMSNEVGDAFAAWVRKPPMIIDESDGQIQTAREAIAMGYIGASHKNCKGVFKGLANACLIASRNRANPAARYQISGEDLSNVGPISLQQDLTVMATLGIADVERNGHHYFRGLSALPSDMQAAVLRAHPDLFHATAKGFPATRIEGGRMQIGSVIDAPFGTAFDFNTARFTPIAKWVFEG